MKPLPDRADRQGIPTIGGRVVQWWMDGERHGANRLLDIGLVPLELAYRGVMRLRTWSYARGLLSVHAVPVPVVCVGNLTVGGTGKTPVTRWIVAELARRGAHPGIVHGGYGHDESELHRRWQPALPVVAMRDRVRAARLAVDAGADLVVLDDGFQHLRLARDLDIVVVPAERWSRNARMLPRGPWREPPSALRRARVAAIVRRTVPADRALEVSRAVARLAPDIELVQLRLDATTWLSWGSGSVEPGAGPEGPCIAVAGIGDPAAFVRQATDAGAKIDEVLVFRDHFRYRPADVARIHHWARGRSIVTTAKDAVKLEAVAPGTPFWVLEQTVIPEAGAEALMNRLDDLR